MSKNFILNIDWIENQWLATMIRDLSCTLETNEQHLWLIKIQVFFVHYDVRTIFETFFYQPIQKILNFFASQNLNKSSPIAYKY